MGGAASTACTVNQDNGRVSALTATGTCYIQARFAAAGNYEAVEWFNISGSDGVTIGTHGDVYADTLGSFSLEPSSSLPESDLRGALEFRAWDQADTSGGAASTVCSAGESDGTVTALDAAGTCYIQARFGALGSYSESDWFNLSGSNGIAVSLGWDIYADTLVVNATLAPDSAFPVPPQGRTLELRVWDQADTSGGAASTVCTVGADGRVSAGAGAGTCYIQARMEAQGSYQASGWVNMSGSGGIRVTGSTDIYSDTLVVSAAMDPLSPLPTRDGGGALELRSWNQADTSGGAASSVCTVAGDGEVTAGAAAGTCWIQARFGASGDYTGSAWFNLSGDNGVSIATAPLSQAAPSGDFYPSSMRTGQTIAPSSLPAGVQGEGPWSFGWSIYREILLIVVSLSTRAMGMSGPAGTQQTIESELKPAFRPYPTSTKPPSGGIFPVR